MNSTRASPLVDDYYTLPHDDTNLRPAMEVLSDCLSRLPRVSGCCHPSGTRTVPCRIQEPSQMQASAPCILGWGVTDGINQWHCPTMFPDDGKQFDPFSFIVRLPTESARVVGDHL